jgi:hypothetical protein
MQPLVIRALARYRAAITAVSPRQIGHNAGFGTISRAVTLAAVGRPRFPIAKSSIAEARIAISQGA